MSGREEERGGAVVGLLWERRAAAWEGDCQRAGLFAEEGRRVGEGKMEDDGVCGDGLPARALRARAARPGCSLCCMPSWRLDVREGPALPG